MIYRVFQSCGVRQYREVYRTEDKQKALDNANNGEIVTEDDTIIYPKYNYHTYDTPFKCFQI